MKSSFVHCGRTVKLTGGESRHSWPGRDVRYGWRFSSSQVKKVTRLSITEDERKNVKQIRA